MDSLMFTLSRIVFPDSDFEKDKELFFRYEKFGEPVVCKYRFDTWMNLFAARKWYSYCALGKLYLKVSACGKAKIELYGHNLDGAHSSDDSLLFSHDYDFGSERSEYEICVEDAEKYDGISFCFIHDKDADTKFIGASWCTDTPPLRNHRLAIATCTFKREEYIKKTIRKFSDFMDNNIELSEKIHLYVIDNGKTLPLELSNFYVDIVPNLNAGGAGGFCRGLMFAYDNNYSRCLFMDDDVEIFPESFFRTLVLSEYFKEEYKDAFISSPMMSIYDKSMCVENLTVQSGLWLKGYYHDMAVTDLYNVLKVIDIDKSLFDKVYTSSAWWYACFSTSLTKDEYPLPVFFRGDDAEWSWRFRGQHHVSMNGICIWHAPFGWRVEKVADYYYLPRNMFWINSIYTKDFKLNYRSLFDRTFNYLIQTYNYCCVELFLQAVRDILKGGRIYHEDPEVQYKRIRAFANEKSDAFHCDEAMELEKAKDKIAPKRGTLKYKILNKLYRITRNGMLLPKIFFLRADGIAPEWVPPVSCFIFRKHVKVYNIVTKTCEIRVFDRKKIKEYQKEYKVLMKKLTYNYDSLHKELSATFAAMTKRDFWNRYLELSE